MHHHRIHDDLKLCDVHPLALLPPPRVVVGSAATSARERRGGGARERGRGGGAGEREVTESGLGRGEDVGARRICICREPACRRRGRRPEGIREVHEADGAWIR
jgi:hypothetical protein